MSIFRSPPSVVILGALIGLSACRSADPVTVLDIKDYTGVDLCPAAAVHDVTTKEERDTTPGFSFHVIVGLTPKCAASLEKQLVAISPTECTLEHVRGQGCFVKDAYPTSAKHSSIMVHPVGRNRFDLRFYT